MKFRLRLFLTAIVLASLVVVCAAKYDPSRTPSQSTYVMTNDDGLLHSYISFFLAGTSGSNPTLTFQTNVNSGGKGIGGGFFGTPRVNLVHDSSAQCAYVANAGTGDVASVNIATETRVGNFFGSATDSGNTNGIGIVLNDNYLYAGYTASNTIGTFAIGAGCQLTFLGDVTAAGLNGGWVGGMAIHGNILVVAYGDGSIQSFNIANGVPMSNNDEQNSTGFAAAYFPEGVDITQDGHFAIFGDASIPTTIEISDISSGKLTQTVQYTVGTAHSAVGPGFNSASVWLSPDESLLYIGNSQGNTVTAAFFNKNTGKISPGCSSAPLTNFYNPWTYVGSLVTRDNTGTGGVLYFAEFAPAGSSIGILQVTSNGTTCTLTEPPTSPVTDAFSGGLLSIQAFPPRLF
jgi:hypothetical protein